MYIGKKYKKAVYRRYTDKTFQTEIPHDPNLGFMGPTIRAEVKAFTFYHLFVSEANTDCFIGSFDRRCAIRILF